MPLVLSKLEQEYYTLVFQLLKELLEVPSQEDFHEENSPEKENQEGEGENDEVKVETQEIISATRFIEVFQKCSLNVVEVKRIWGLCSVDNQYMLEDGFQKALKCVAMIQSNIPLDDIEQGFSKVLPMPKFSHSEIEDCYQIMEKKRLKELKTLERTLFAKRQDALDRRAERREAVLNKKKFKVTQEEDPSLPKESIHVEVTELKYIEDAPGEISSYFRYKIETEAQNLSQYRSGHKYQVYRKFNDFELFHSCFT